MTHASILKELGESHANRAEKIGHGCKHYNVRDWIRRNNKLGSIPIEWLAHVAAAHPSATVEDLANMVAAEEIGV